MECGWRTCPVNVLLGDKSNQKKNDICNRCKELGNSFLSEATKDDIKMNGHESKNENSATHNISHDMKKHYFSG